jgi:hypothetical protein
MKLKTLTFIGPLFDAVESNCRCEILISETAKKNPYISPKTSAAHK